MNMPGAQPIGLHPGQFAAVPDAEAVRDLVDRKAADRREHPPLGAPLASRQGRFLGLDGFQLGVGLGQAERLESAWACAWRFTRSNSAGWRAWIASIRLAIRAAIRSFQNVFSVTVKPGMGRLLG